MISRHLLISGRVQGVGFRHFTRKNAQKLGLAGWVKNLADGRVEAVFQGDEIKVKEMIGRVREGPPASWVEKVEEKEDTVQNFSDFQVRY